MGKKLGPTILLADFSVSVCTIFTGERHHQPESAVSCPSWSWDPLQVEKAVCNGAEKDI